MQFLFSSIGSINSNQHPASPLYDKSPRAKTNPGSCSMIFSTVSYASPVQSQSPIATKLKLEDTLAVRWVDALNVLELLLYHDFYFHEILLIRTNK